jgi:hypothetical protein
MSNRLGMVLSACEQMPKNSCLPQVVRLQKVAHKSSVSESLLIQVLRTLKYSWDKLTGQIGGGSSAKSRIGSASAVGWIHIGRGSENEVDKAPLTSRSRECRFYSIPFSLGHDVPPRTERDDQ